MCMFTCGVTSWADLEKSFRSSLSLIPLVVPEAGFFWPGGSKSGKSSWSYFVVFL